jgi:streptogramin lyase
MIRFVLAAGIALAAIACAAPALAQPACPSRLFVSGYLSTVHVFDACTGAYLRDLDVRSRLAGAQAVRLGPDRRIHVVAEETGTIHRYRNDTLAWDGVYATAPAGAGPTAIDFDADGRAWVAAFNSDSVRRYAPDGTLVDVPLPTNAAINGPDNGMTFAAGSLWIPSYYTNSLVRHDPATGTTSVAIPSQAAGLFRTRGVLPIADGSGLFVTSEGSGRLLRYTFATGETVQVGGAFVGPTGIAYAPDGMLLIVDNRAVVRVNPATGEKLGTLVASGAGGVDAPTFLAVIPVPEVPAGTAEAVEYYHAALDHYFISLTPAEIAALDSGALAGWARTGLTFRGWSQPGPETRPVCRFWIPPGYGSSHFFSADPAECQRVREQFPAFVYEGEPFHIALPDPVTGACVAGTAPIFRFFNNRPDANHRYTTSLGVAREMIARGHTAEGYGPGPTFPIMCEVR